MSNSTRPGAVKLNHDQKMRLDLSSRPRREQGEKLNIFE